MAEARQFIINELLCFINNNYEFIQNDKFISSVLDFYTLEQLITSKKTLLSDLELVLNDKFKLPSRGKTKKEKFDDIIDIIKHIKDNNLDKLMPSYVALKLNNLPKNALNDSNNENILDKINEIKCLIVQLDNKLAMLNVHSNVSFLEHTHSTNWAECVPNADCSIKTTQPVIAIHNRRKLRYTTNEKWPFKFKFIKFIC